MKFEEKAFKGDNRKLLIECIKAREREKDSKGWMGERERIFTDKMDLVLERRSFRRRELKTLG